MITDDEFKTLSELLGYPNPEGLHPAEARLRDFARRLMQHETAALDSDSIVAACNCGTKSPEIRYHKVGCKYRLIEERNGLKRLLGEARDAFRKIAHNPGGCDNETGFTSGHISRDLLTRIDATLDPNNLEGPPRTREELAADARALDSVAPTPAEKFQLMFRGTPKTGQHQQVAEEMRAARDNASADSMTVEEFREQSNP